MEYLALLRGINVGQHNRITMAELRTAFVAARFANVRTYISSGNVMLSSTHSLTTVTQRSRAAVRDCGLAVPVAVFAATTIVHGLANVPDWWRNPPAGSISNAIFVCPPTPPATIMEAMGQTDDEQSWVDGPIIFVTSQGPKLMATRWARVPATITPLITIRNAQTTRKLGELLGERV